MSAGLREVAPFSFLSNHGQVLLAIAHDPRARMRDIAAAVGITERATQRIVAELSAVRLARPPWTTQRLTRVRTDLPILLPTQRDVDLGSLLNALLPLEPPTSGAPSSK